MQLYAVTPHSWNLRIIKLQYPWRFRDDTGIAVFTIEMNIRIELETRIRYPRNVELIRTRKKLEYDIIVNHANDRRSTTPVCTK